MSTVHYWLLSGFYPFGVLAVQGWLILKLSLTKLWSELG